MRGLAEVSILRRTRERRRRVGDVVQEINARSCDNI